jgi:hypothetical protein
LLYIRSIYRIAEYATGFGGVIARTEWAFYVSDGLATALSIVTYGTLFIGNYLPKRTSTISNNDTEASKVQSRSLDTSDTANQ